ATDNGLPQNSVLAILQSRDGYLWIATSDGLVRFDGLKSTVFNSGNTDGLESNRFTCLYEDDLGALWIGSEDGGVALYRKGKFRTVARANQLPSKLVLGICKDSDGGVVVFTSAGFESPSLVHLPSSEATDFTPTLISTAGRLYRCEKESVWYLEGSLLYILSNGAWKSYPLPEGEREEDIQSVLEDRQGNLWVAAKASTLIPVTR